ncbi:MAG: septum formation inhibitor Maf, partial [Verrucomicrobia bacterium]|nr:septum formation inhibitor Maf [Verrucomicrobiota bacterium]
MNLSKIYPLFLIAHSLAAADPVRDFWFNGAEINRYELSQARYGTNHPGHVEFVFVTEPFLIDEQVKDESGSGRSTDVLKLNALRTFNTGIYSYRTMTSTFKPIDLDRFPHALKTNTSVQDWCGQVFQQINRRDEAWQGHLFSYFEDAGDQTFKLADAWLEDELWLLIRLDPSRLPRGEIEVVPGALHTRLTHQPNEVFRAVGELKTGSKLSTFTLRYPDHERTLTIGFDTEFPHIIRGWTDAGPHGTTTAHLQDRIMNSYYWSENQPEDRAKRRQLGL